jgi:transcriptional regulator with XRE-family HTH domain
MRVHKGGRQTVLDRFNYLLNYWGLTEEQFAKESGLEIAEIKRLKKDPATLSEPIWKCVNTYDPNISRDWMLFNEGKMLVMDTTREIDDYTDINQRVKDIRLKNQLNQAEMARVLGCARSTYANIENNSQTISFKHARLLKRRFNISYNYIIDGSTEPSTLDDLNKKVAALQAHLDSVRASNDALIKAIDHMTKPQ